MTNNMMGRNVTENGRRDHLIPAKLIIFFFHDRGQRQRRSCLVALCLNLTVKWPGEEKTTIQLFPIISVDHAEFSL